ncbi:MAG: heme o synthase [Polyangia bacterium]|jgi:protoheme IX farnesyltransferase
MKSRAETLPAPARAFATLSSLVELSKPRITFMVLITTLGGLWLAPGSRDPMLWAATLAGVMLVVAGANALNMYLERDTDALMRRTRNRPLPSGRLSPEVALFCGLLWSALAIPLLTFAVNPLTGFLAGLSLVLYVLVYTPMKRRSTAALLVGAVPGAIPPLMGWTAATGSLGSGGVALFLILFVWQLPHFIAISLFRAEEYKAAGLKVVPIERGVQGAKERIAFYSLLMLAVSLQVVRAGIGGAFYLAAALALGGGLVTLALYGLSREARDKWARWYFLYTLVYLPALFIALVVSHP